MVSAIVLFLDAALRGEIQLITSDIKLFAFKPVKKFQELRWIAKMVSNYVDLKCI